MVDVDLRYSEKSAKMEAIEEFLGVLPDGSFLPLTTRQRLAFRTPERKLEYKVEKARKRTKKIIEYITRLTPWEEDTKDIALLREFVLECLSPFKRQTLLINNALHDEATDVRISWPLYLLSWMFVSGCIVFFIYWIFAWGVYQGEAVLGAWGAVYGTSTARDVLLVQISKIVVINYLPALAMQAQLIRIRKVLADISLNYINRGESSNNVHAAEDDGSVRVIQHVSAACRASRSTDLGSLPAAWLLRQVSLLCSFAPEYYESHHVSLAVFYCM